MAITKTIDPVTRLEGHLRIQVDIDLVGAEFKVIDARASGTMFRGFEVILQGRPPEDAPYLTQRVCGVCPISHAIAAVNALDACGNSPIPANARALRNLVHAQEFVHSHLLHFYQLGLLDYVQGPDRLPFRPHWSSDRRISGKAAEPYADHYVAALDARRQMHEFGALFAGKMPHAPAIVAGGFTGTPRPERIKEARQLLSTVEQFVAGTWQEDLESLSEVYSDYLEIGRGRGNLLAFGGLPQSDGKLTFMPGRIEDASSSVEAMDPSLILEHVKYSWLEGANHHPAIGETLPKFPKGEAYSWIKAPRYEDRSYELGAIARLWINGEYNRGVSVLDRYHARHKESLKLLRTMKTWLDELVSDAPVYVAPSLPADGEGAGLTEAARGALGHWLTLSEGKLSRYQIITPTCWNASPRDSTGERGSLEEALVGTVVEHPEEPIEVLRVVHSFDPCLACAVHVTRPGRTPSTVRVRGFQ